MPYHLSDDGLCVLKEDGQQVDGGCHDTHEQAVAHLQALEANVPDAQAKDFAKSGRVLSGANMNTLTEAVKHLLDVLSKAGFDMTSLQPQEATPEGVIKAAYDIPDERVIAFGSAIKAIGDNRFGGHLVTWGGQDQKDLDGQYFTKDTNFWLKYYAPPRPFLYHHGLDKKLSKTPIGLIDTLRKDDTGLYVEGDYLKFAPGDEDVKGWSDQQIALHNQYVEAVKDLVRRGVIGFSSGSVSHLVEADASGEIKSWPLAEGSGTPTPADQRGNRVYNLKSYSELIIDPLEVNQPELSKEAEMPIETKAADVPTMGNLAPQVTEPSEDEMDMNKMCQMALDALKRAGIALSPEQEQAFTAAMQAAYPNQGDQPAPGMDAAAMQKLAEGFVAKAFDVAAALKAEETQATAFNNALKARIEGAPITNGLPAPAPLKAAPQSSVKVGSKYDQLSAADMAFVHRVMYSAILPGMKTEPMSQEYYRALAEKVEKIGAPVPENAARAVKAIKAGEYRGMGYRVTSDPDATKSNELDYSTQASGGDEWVPDLWDSNLWEIMRLENKIASSIETVDMPSNPYELPVQSTDPTVYFVPETTDETQLTISGSGNPIPDSKLTTAKATLTAKKLALRVGYSTELDEDSIVPWATQLNKQAQRTMLNSIDNVALNGDTQTGATLNVNLVDSTPPATSKYLIFDGLRKQALVTTTTLSVDAGGVAPTLAAIRTARFKMRNAYAADPGNLRIITDTSTYAKLLSMPEFITIDKAGAQATAQVGTLGFIDGIPVFVSNELPLVNTAGKVSNTAGNNILGSLVIYAPYGWRLGYRRRIKLTSEFFGIYDSYQLTATVRLAFINASTDSVAVLYNLAV